MKIHSLISFAVLSLASLSASATTTATASFLLDGGNRGGGTFSGIDANNDGSIQFNELTSFSYQDSAGCRNILMAGNPSANNCTNYLTDIGAYNYQTNTWNTLLVPAKGTTFHAYAISPDPFLPSNPDGIFQESYAISTNLVSVSAPVPEPETYAMLLAGLGVVGMMGRRRNGKKAA